MSWRRVAKATVKEMDTENFLLLETPHQQPLDAATGCYRPLQAKLLSAGMPVTVAQEHKQDNKVWPHLHLAHSYKYAMGPIRMISLA